jgi:hypothetical protein
MTTIFRKFILGALIAALALALLPLTSAFAAGSNAPSTPPAPGTPKDPAVANARLEFAFARQQYAVQRIGLAIDNSDALFARIQMLIDKARGNGKDTAAVQTAFDAYKIAFEKGKPIYSQAKPIVTAHDGFDANGKVIDTEKAKATVKSLGNFLKQYRDTVGDARKALHEAIKAFRAANPRSTPIPTPGGE